MPSIYGKRVTPLDPFQLNLTTVRALAEGLAGRLEQVLVCGGKCACQHAERARCWRSCAASWRRLSVVMSDGLTSDAATVRRGPLPARGFGARRWMLFGGSVDAAGSAARATASA